MIGYRIITGLDIGGSHVVAAAAKIDRGGKIISLEIAESKSLGIQRGTINDLEKLTNAIQSTIHSLQQKSKTKIQEVYININGDYIATRHSLATIPLVEKPNRAICSSDIRKVNHQARLLGLRLEEQVIHEFAQYYIIDEYNKLKNPLGLFGRKLEVDLYLVVSKVTHVENIVKAVNQAGLEVADVVLSGLACGLAILDQREKQEGCVLLDIGSGLTELVFFGGDSIGQVDIIPFGGNDITEAIAAKFKLPFELAEDLKKSYGLVSGKDVSVNREVLIRQDSSYKPIQQKLICELIESKVVQLISLIKEKINNSVYKDRISSGIVITGGTALLTGLLERIECELSLPVRAGTIKNVSFSSGKMPIYATAAGLVYYGLEASIKKDSKLFSEDNLFRKLLQKAREAYQEYF